VLLLIIFTIGLIKFYYWYTKKSYSGKRSKKTRKLLELEYKHYMAANYHSVIMGIMFILGGIQMNKIDGLELIGFYFFIIGLFSMLMGIIYNFKGDRFYNWLKETIS
jgi:hypothetical protein